MQILADRTIDGRRQVILAGGRPLTDLSTRYTLVSPAMLDSEAARSGLQLVTRAFSRGGRKSFTQYSMAVDYLGYRPRLSIFDDHVGTGRMRAMVGILRLVCANGLVVGSATQTGAHSHRGNADRGAEWLGEFFAQQADALRAALQANVDKVESLRYSPLEPRHDALINAMGPRSRNALEIAAQGYQDGPTPSRWTYVQALTDMAKTAEPAARVRLELLASNLIS